MDGALIRSGDNFPVDPGNAHACVVAGVLFVEDLNGVVAQRRFFGGADRRFSQACLHLTDERKFRAAFNPILNDAGVLTEGHVELVGEFQIRKHGVVHHLGKRRILQRAHFLELGKYVVGQMFAEVRRELRHGVSETGTQFRFVHCVCLLARVVTAARLMG